MFRIFTITLMMLSSVASAQNCGISEFVDGYVKASKETDSTGNLMLVFGQELNDKYDNNLISSEQSEAEGVQRRWAWLTRVIGRTITSEMTIVEDCKSQTAFVRGLNSQNEYVVFFLGVEGQNSAYRINSLHTYNAVGSLCDSIQGTQDF